ncbi:MULTISPECIES: hypothetical protein, partial [unclassified Marinobacter]|uniref:hypothetical protein n=1 Tax=unclassified Marinobacter TaxID=83889 RepID=UPI001A7E47B2
GFCQVDADHGILMHGLLLNSWIVSATSILAHCDADLEWGGDHPISEEHGKKKKKSDLPRNPLKNTKLKTKTF